MKKVVLLNPAIGSKNLGDHVIVDAVKRVFDNLGIIFSAEISTHRTWGKAEIRAAKNADFFVVAGSNLLTNSLFPLSHPQWKISFREFWYLRGKTILFGPGWRSDESDLTHFTTALYKILLAKNVPQSVRDIASFKKLQGTRRNIMLTHVPLSGE